jgi:hypothetical protein
LLLCLSELVVIADVLKKVQQTQKMNMEEREKPYEDAVRTVFP